MHNSSYRSGFAAIIGRPNVGKSTLMNRLIGMKIAITSNKPQTTRNKIKTVYTSDEGQIVFLDTPGIHTAKNKLSEYMVKAATSTLKDADVVFWLVEASTFIGRGDKDIAKQLVATGNWKFGHLPLSNNAKLNKKIKSNTFKARYPMCLNCGKPNPNMFAICCCSSCKEEFT